MDNGTIMRVAKAIQDSNASISSEDAKAFAEYMVKCANAGIDGYREGVLKVVLPIVYISGIAFTYGLWCAFEKFEQWKRNKKERKPKE